MAANVVRNSNVQDKVDTLAGGYEAIDPRNNEEYFNKYFMPVDDNNSFRPYGEGLVDHAASTATIVLTQIPKGNDVESSIEDTVDYFNDFSSTINEATGEPPTGNTIPRLKSLGPDYFGVFKNFSLLSVSETRAEISKISFNFGNKWNAYFFGQQPRVYNFTGMFLDAMNYPYYEEFMRAYDSYLAGGKCVERGFKLYMSYDGKIVSGWMLGIDTNDNSADKYTKSFSFRLLVADEDFYRINNQYDEDGLFVGLKVKELSNLHHLSDNVLYTPTDVTYPLQK